MIKENRRDKMQRLILKRIKKKSDMPKNPILISYIELNKMNFDFIFDANDRCFFKGNNKIYEVVNKIE